MVYLHDVVGENHPSYWLSVSCIRRSSPRKVMEAIESLKMTRPRKRIQIKACKAPLPKDMGSLKNPNFEAKISTVSKEVLLLES